MSSTGSANRKRSRARNRDALKSPESQHRSDRPKNRRRSNSRRRSNTNQGEPNPQILQQLLDKISSISSSVDKLNKRITCLESPPAKDTDHMVSELQYTSCPEPVDSSDHISVVVKPDRLLVRKFRSRNPGLQF